jgi:hypothetical protein
MTRAMIEPRTQRATKDTEGRGGIAVTGLFRLFDSFRACLCVLCSFLCVLCLAREASAQFQMPDAREMSGIPRPVDDLPNGAISVRLIRGSLSNNLTAHPVDLHVGPKVITVKTDENGRAEFKDFLTGTGAAMVKATAEVDGEHLESQEFPAPTRGGIRLMLVATDPAKKNAPATPAATGSVVLGSQSRFVLQPREEAVDIFYLLDISNSQSVPVNPPTPFAFDMPDGASGTTIMDGSSPQASVKGTRVTVAGPFAPGHTFVQVATTLPAEGGWIEVAQKLPAKLDELAVIVKKVGDTMLKSPQLKEQREMPAEGEMFIAATGGPVDAGRPIELTVEGVPHHSQAPRRVALTLAVAVAVMGAWFATRTSADSTTVAADHKRLIARREKLFNELARLEQDRRSGRADDRRYAVRREELIASLEQIYRSLDNQDVGIQPAARAGLSPTLDRVGTA